MQSSPFPPMADKRSHAVNLAIDAAVEGSAGHILWTLRRHGSEDNVALVEILAEALARVSADRSTSNHRVDL